MSNEEENKYPGFIDGLKNSNMKSNRALISTNFEQIQELIKYAFKKILPNSLNEKNMLGLNSNIKSLLFELSNESEKYYNLDYYIKSGVYLNILIENNKDDVLIDRTIAITKNYLEIAKLTKDSRVTKIALDIGKLVHEIKEDNKEYPGMFVKEIDPDFTQLKDLMFPK